MMHDPDRASHLHDSFDAYKAKTGTTINHFYEKLLLLQDRMNTASGRRLAKERHHVMEAFLERFFLEWNGEA
jgi:uncharacterized protein